MDADEFAVLEPHLEIVDLPRGTVLYDTGDTIRYAYFPHDAIVCLVGAMEDGRQVEVALFGREGLCGLLGAMIAREAFGRYMCSSRHLIGHSASESDRVEPVRPDQAAIIFSFASGTASKKVCIGVLPKHHRP